jgi:hypothetical protein
MKVNVITVNVIRGNVITGYVIRGNVITGYVSTVMLAQFMLMWLCYQS